MRFRDRVDAGQRLAAALLPLKLKNPVVLALPRGGVPVGYEVARALGAPLDLVLVRKIGAPGQSEFAIGAIAEGDPVEVIVDAGLVERLYVSDTYLTETQAEAEREIARRRRVYLGERPRAEVRGKCAIVVDDGIATGATMRAALLAVRRRDPARLVLAVPTAPPDTLALLRDEVDDVVCLDTPEPFFAVGHHYRDFPQLTDDEVIALLGAISPPAR